MAFVMAWSAPRVSLPRRSWLGAFERVQRPV
jgi:hypothetical protein